MKISYDMFGKAFLQKITEFELLALDEDTRTDAVDSYMKVAVSEFKKNCKYDLVGTADDAEREFAVDIEDNDVDELVDIISEGMVVQWMKPYLHRQELLENTLNTRDFTTYSPAELLLRVGNAYREAQARFTQMIREYSYNHGDLTDLHI